MLVYAATNLLGNNNEETIMYADDTIILAETSDSMQKCLNSLEYYCNINGLFINTSNT